MTFWNAPLHPVGAPPEDRGGNKNSITTKMYLIESFEQNIMEGGKQKAAIVSFALNITNDKKN